MPGTEVPQLQYAPPPPLIQRRKFRQWIAIGLITCFVLSAFAWGPRVWLRVQLSYWFWQCATYPAPAERVVFTTISDDGDDLAKGEAGGYRAGEVYFEGRRVPPCWEKLYESLSPPGLRSSGTAFLHERTTPAGRETLVAVDILRPNGCSIRVGPIAGCELRLQIRTLEIAGIARNIRELKTTGEWIFCAVKAPQESTRDFRVFAGQADSQDPTHFTFCVETIAPKPFRWTIDGWLNDDGSVRFDEPKLIKPNLTPPAQASKE